MPKPKVPQWFAQQNSAVIRCEQCPRLRQYCLKVAQEKRSAFRNDEYHALPVQNFGDPNARVLIVGLAPAAHGANRTGRMFTGDRSGEWLYRALYKAGFANQPTSYHVNDGLALHDCLITAVCRCAPPQNKPLPDEIKNCSVFLKQTLSQTPWEVALALGGIAWKQLEKNLELKLPNFSHGAQIIASNHKLLIASYHPSQQNTFTKKLTEEMFDDIFKKINNHLKKSKKVL